MVGCLVACDSLGSKLVCELSAVCSPRSALFFTAMSDSDFTVPWLQNRKGNLKEPLALFLRCCAAVAATQRRRQAE